MSYQSIYDHLDTVKKIRNEVSRLGRDYDRLCALADRAAEFIRSADYNTDPAGHLVAGVQALPQRSRVKATKWVASYFRDVHNVTKTDDGRFRLKRDGTGKKAPVAGFPQWETFHEFVLRKESEAGGESNAYNADQEFSNMEKSIRKKAEKAEANGDTLAAEQFRALAEQAEAVEAEYKRRVSLAEQAKVDADSAA